VPAIFEIEVPTKMALPPLPLILSDRPGLIRVVWKPFCTQRLVGQAVDREVVVHNIVHHRRRCCQAEHIEQDGVPDVGMVFKDQLPGVVQFVVPAPLFQISCANKG